MQIFLIVLYPLLTHFSINSGKHELQVAAIIALATGVLYQGLRSKNLVVWLIWLGVSALSVVLALKNQAIFVLYWPPIVLPFLVATAFIRSLLPGHEPIVTAIGELHRGPLSQAMRNYSRGVTVMWAISLSLMFAWGVALPLLGEHQLWSIFTNFVNYALVGLLFLGEFALRIKLFPEHDHPKLIEYLKIVLKTDIRKIN